MNETEANYGPTTIQLHVELARKFARQGNMALVLAHGTYDIPPKTFVVPPDHVIVHLCMPGVRLPQSIVNERFYDIFTNADAIRSLLAGTLKNVPPVLLGWKSRTYGPGETCPDLTLAMADPGWPGMGLHRLPLRSPLRAVNVGFYKHASSLKSVSGPVPGPVAGYGAGHTSTTSDLAAHFKGVVFVVACREPNVQNRADTDAKRRFWAKYFHDTEFSRKLRSRRRLPDANDGPTPKKSKTSEAVPMNIDGGSNDGGRDNISTLTNAFSKLTINVRGMSNAQRTRIATELRRRANAKRAEAAPMNVNRR